MMRGSANQAATVSCIYPSLFSADEDVGAPRKGCDSPKAKHIVQGRIRDKLTIAFRDNFNKNDKLKALYDKRYRDPGSADVLVGCIKFSHLATSQRKRCEILLRLWQLP